MPTVYDLEMHPALLLSVIKRQAGTLDKGVAEAVMNAVEAGASRVDIIHEEGETNRLSIIDDGTGITSLEGLREFWAKFGTPHDESEEGRKIWAQFRIGRGQIFSFGRNHWRTHTFSMTVDINKSTQYELEQNLLVVEGCRIDIDLYNSLHSNGYASINAFKEAIKQQVEFVAVPIFFNGEQISHDPATLKWDHEDADGYYSWTVGSGLSIYNLGIFVRNYDACYFGLMGIVISKKQLKVNYARNDIQSDCEIWNRVRTVLEAVKLSRREDKTKKKVHRLSHHERISCLRDLRDRRQNWRSVRALNLLELANDRVTNLDAMRLNSLPWTFAALGDLMADRLMDCKSAICLDRAILSNLGYTGAPGDFFTWLSGEDDFGHTVGLYNSFENLTASVDRSIRNVILAQSDLTIVERRLLKILNDEGQWNGRRICMGTSNIALAWTDGKSFIALAREYVKPLHLSSYYDASHLVHILIHEMAHDESTEYSHVHGEEFYRRFHDICSVSNGPSFLCGSLPAKMRQSRVFEKHNRALAKAERMKEIRAAKLGIGLGQAKIKRGRRPVGAVCEEVSTS